MDISAAARTALEAWASVVGTAPLELLPRAHNPLWRVVDETGRPFVLRQLPEHPPGVGPVEEFRVLCHLQSAAIPVALPVVSDEGSIHTSVDGRRYALLPLLPSDPRNHEHRPDAPAVCRAIGAAIGRLDKALADCPWQVNSFVDDPARDILDGALPKLPPEFTRSVAPHVDTLRTAVDGLPVQRTHGDCNTGNVLVHDRQVSGFIDLDHLPLGPRVRDLGYYLVSRLRGHLAHPETAARDVAAMMEVLGAYVAGYHEAYPLSDRELTAVVPLMLLVELGSASWCLYGWVPDPDGYERSAHTVRWMVEHLAELTDAAASTP